jgi:hypothetical protein
MNIISSLHKIFNYIHSFTFNFSNVAKIFEDHVMSYTSYLLGKMSRVDKLDVFCFKIIDSPKSGHIFFIKEALVNHSFMLTTYHFIHSVIALDVRAHYYYTYILYSD